MKSEFYKKKSDVNNIDVIIVVCGKKTFAVRMYASLHERQQFSFLRGGMWGVIIITGKNIGERKKIRQQLKTLRKSFFNEV